MFNARRLFVEDDKRKRFWDYTESPRLLWRGKYSDIIRLRVSEALRKVDSGNYFKTKPIFIPALDMIKIDETYLYKYAKAFQKTSNFTYYPIVQTDEEYSQLDRNFIVKKHQDSHHVTEWYLCETFVLEPLLDYWWGVASRANVNTAVVGQANTTILTGSRGSIRFKYDWYFQELTISAIVNPNLELKCIHTLDIIDRYRKFHSELLELPYNGFFIWKGMVCRVIS
jgi:hypothetical protein